MVIGVFINIAKSPWSGCCKMGTRPVLKGFSVLHSSLDMYRLPGEKLIVVSVFSNHPVNQNNTQSLPSSLPLFHRTLERSISAGLPSAIRCKASSSQ